MFNPMPRSIQVGAYVLSFLLAVLYVPYISGAALSPRWILLALTLPFCLLLVHKIEFTIVHQIGLVYLIVALISLIWTTTDNGWFEFIKLLILAEAFIVGTCLVSLKRVFEGLALGLSVSSIFVLLGQTGGLFVNSNTLAELNAIVLVGLCVYHSEFYIIGLIPGIVYGGRGAIFTLLVLGIIWCWNRYRGISLALIVTVAINIFAIWYFGNRIWTITARFDIWSTIIKNVTLLGAGLGSFYNNIPIYAHNDLLHTLFELGVIGAILFALFFYRVMMIGLKERYIVGAFLIISCFDFPFHLPVSAFIAMLSCGYIIGHRDFIFTKVNEGRI